ncbi:protoporphyrinogen oxidase HemJ [Cognatishimia sp. SS12]|uniref:protoporphyrinogen oxidase HemJ n=1 Tax=Cognatishimia sp. SS12 TaxID=2979465 RepID=UPI00232BCC51|nr:protoporphyrinogen oxidase HemJ [Cognatishimia sp. SS12]MDC0737741.1 protoporphyrinogen oxidase HemJ [Cognatishimia sp. SS12]
MTNFLSDYYLWIKALHIMAVISWMAGLFYLPRLFVYHVERAQPGDQLDQTFQVMEFKLLKVIMGPASVATWLFGLLLMLTPGIVDWGAVWPYTKAVGVIAMTGFHHWLMACRKSFEQGDNQLTGRQYRMMNEVPTLLMALIVLSVVVKF